MTSKKQIKNDEERVAHLLLRDPSMDAVTIAKKCGLSKQKVWRIIRKMEERGVIFSHPASLNLKNFGKRSFLILFERSTKVVDDELIKQMTQPELLDELEKEDIAAWVEDSYYLSGGYDWAIIITVDEHKDLIRFIEHWRKYYGEYFSRVIHSEIMWVATRNSIRNPNTTEISEILR